MVKIAIKFSPCNVVYFFKLEFHTLIFTTLYVLIFHSSLHYPFFLQIFEWTLSIKRKGIVGFPSIVFFKPGERKRHRIHWSREKLALSCHIWHKAQNIVEIAYSYVSCPTVNGDTGMSRTTLSLYI